MDIVEILKQELHDAKLIIPLQDGGQKRVFSCEHRIYGSCVIKVFKTENPERIARELEAVRRLVGLEVSNVPIIREITTISGIFDRHIVLIEDRIEGDDLYDYIRNYEITKQFVMKLCGDLLFTAIDLEKVQIVHRDIKPKNIKIDTTFKTWLMDFGIARILDMESITNTEAFRGPHSPGYSPPEQITNRKNSIDNRADLFSIGMVIYECLAGDNPFIKGAKDVNEIIERVLNFELPILNIPWDKNSTFSNFIQSLTRKQVHQRPSNCQEAFTWFQNISTGLGGQ